MFEEGAVEMMIGTADGSISARAAKTGDLVFGHRCVPKDKKEADMRLLCIQHERKTALIAFSSTGDGKCRLAVLTVV